MIRADKKPMVIAISAVLLTLAGPGMVGNAMAQQAADTGAQAEMTVISVTGIRASKQKSLDTKKNSGASVEVVSAEDIGKMPDKNIADAVQRLPGVNIGATSAGQFDEAERVSLRGTSPSLTLTTLNGHSVSSGDWHVADQTSSGRSVGFALLPSELVSQVIVYKSSQADIVEGGQIGTVDIISRRPLDFKKQLTFEAAIGAVYADLPNKTDPQFSGLVNWKNDTGTFGVMVQGFSEKRAIRRDSQEHLDWRTISPTSTLAKAHPELANVAYSGLIGSSLFDGVRERKGGMLALEAKPTRDLTLGVTGMYASLNATNYNRNHMADFSDAIGSGNGVQNFQYALSPSGKTINHLALPNQGPRVDDSTPPSEVVESYVRDGARSTSGFLDLNAKYRVSDDLDVKAQLGYTKGEGKTPKQNSVEVNVYNSASAYTLYGMNHAADVSYGSLDTSNFKNPNLVLTGAGGTSISTLDEEKNGQLDFTYRLSQGMFNRIKFGARYSSHTRELHQIAPALLTDTLPPWDGSTYPSDFGSNLGGDFPRNGWFIGAADLQQWKDGNLDADPLRRELLRSEFKLTEKNAAAYAMTEFEADKLSGNFGVRAVRTREDALVNIPVAAAACPALKPCPSVPSAITTSVYGTYYQAPISNTYTNLLPSLNLRYELERGMIGRVALNRTLARADYADLAGAISGVDNLTHKATGGNPNLKPSTSDNIDASIAWYFGPRALLSAGIFHSNIHDYVKFGDTLVTLFNTTTNKEDTYTVTAPGAISARVQGFELAYEQPIGAGFGFNANYTYADSKDADGARMKGQSKHTYNLGAYYEDDKFSARIAYNGRSDYIISINRTGPTTQNAPFKTLSASVQYKLTENLSVSLDGLNLNNPISKAYAFNEEQPRAFRENGRQYYLNLRVKY
jgi:iron complex outermembrane receptor protein